MTTPIVADELELLHVDKQHTSHSLDTIDGKINGYGKASPSKCHETLTKRGSINLRKMDCHSDTINARDILLSVNAGNINCSAAANLPETGYVTHFKHPQIYARRRLWTIIGVLFACLCLVTIGAILFYAYGIGPCGRKYNYMHFTVRYLPYIFI